MNRKISLGVTIALMSLAAAVAIVITAGYSMFDFNSRMQSLRESEVMYSKLNEIDGYVRQSFYGDIDEEQLMNAVARGYVSGLNDKYARYMTPEEYKAQMDAYESQKASIGISVVMDPSGYMKVIEVFADSPAEEAGIEVGESHRRSGRHRSECGKLSEAEYLHGRRGGFHPGSGGPSGQPGR